MYKVKNEDPAIIARFRETPDEPIEIILKHPEDLANRWEKLSKYLRLPYESSIKKVELLYEFVDYYIESSELKKETVCQTGCAHCCYFDVEVSAVEAAYIGHHTGLTVIPRTNRLKSGYHLKRQYCPFLDQNSATCTIYKWRPIPCRTFFTLDNPAFCASEGAVHSTFTFASSDFFLYVCSILAKVSNFHEADIREWFKEHQ